MVQFQKSLISLILVAVSLLLGGCGTPNTRVVAVSGGVQMHPQQMYQREPSIPAVVHQGRWVPMGTPGTVGAISGGYQGQGSHIAVPLQAVVVFSGNGNSQSAQAVEGRAGRGGNTIVGMKRGEIPASAPAEKGKDLWKWRHHDATNENPKPCVFERKLSEREIPSFCSEARTLPRGKGQTITQWYLKAEEEGFKALSQ